MLPDPYNIKSMIDVLVCGPGFKAPDYGALRDKIMTKVVEYIPTSPC